TRLLLDRAAFHQDPHPLHAAQLPHDLRVHPRNRRETPRPVLAIVRPRDPCGLVRFPFGGHAEPGRPRRRRRQSITLLQMPLYASMRRSRRKGQLRRTSSMRRGSHSTISVSSRSCDPSASTTPNGSATNDPPQNSSPCSGGPSYPTRFTAATY